MHRHTQLVLARLQRETSGKTRQAISFRVLCTAVGIPRDLQPQLLRALIAEGYVLRDNDDDEICLTQSGTRMATSPLS